MTKLAYLDCPTGIAGDMCLGALVDGGVPLEYLREGLRGLGIEAECHLRSEKVRRQGQMATQVHVDLPPGAPDSRHLPEIESLIQAAQLPRRAGEWSLQVFRHLAVAEGSVHGIEPEKVHFHEVGAADALADIVGTCLGLDWLGIEELYCSALPTGGGSVRSAHGYLPVPVPAVLKLWESRRVPVYSNGIDRELVTPTGAAIAVALATAFGPPPPMELEKVGWGAGGQDLSVPNLLRLWIGHRPSPTADRAVETEAICVLETQIDDLNPQAIGYVFEALLAAGAADVFTQAIGMKKSRPGILLTAICPPDRVPACETAIFRETTTLGIRHLTQLRSVLRREIYAVETPWGPVSVKVARQGSGDGAAVVNVQPEYEDCAELARKFNQPWRAIHQMALQAWHDLKSEGEESPGQQILT